MLLSISLIGASMNIPCAVPMCVTQVHLFKGVFTTKCVVEHSMACIFVLFTGNFDLVLVVFFLVSLLQQIYRVFLIV